MKSVILTLCLAAFLIGCMVLVYEAFSAVARHAPW